jgi:Leucine-rich repeat (LRR) protein
MNIEELHSQLIEAYSTQNLNKIALTLINLYKDKQFGTLNKIAEIVEETVEIEIAPDGKGFSKFIMLYHPDRGDFHRKTINELAANKDFDGLLGYSHILKLLHIDEIASTIESFEDIDYSPVYEWDIKPQEYSVVKDTEEEPLKAENIKVHKACTFYEAVKIRHYGRLDIEFPTYYLEDIDEIELSQSDIDNLEGAEYCIHVVTLDLSDNSITDISNLWGLKRLEEINLSDNQLSIIDTLSNLQNLKSVHLANNHISDISPLFELENLEFVDLSGNPVPPSQIKELEGLGIEIEKDRI